MKTQFNLYVTDWAPNGTNDLLVCDEDHRIVECVQEATFGIDVTKHRSPINDLVADDSQVFSIRRLKDGELLPSELTLVRQISLETLRRKLAVSPCDPDGRGIRAALKRAGIKLNGDE